ncbi:uncharacterized protein LOC127798479 isoform X2 [Diospyros lotus]|uniref:uncharacterized protein LOC127798479 isoform X2 n=1 Tax=Diospyros lotus TaxID=55363 RepID=UPI00224D3A34|nr:uncharacterized protein LOC127798479 isoform X2 [Diospyros lotus]
MEPNGAAARLRIPKTPSFSDRFLPVSARSSPESALDGDLSEDDVFWIGDFAENNRSSNLNVPSVSPSGGRSHHGRGVARGENFGILAALPASESDESNLQARSVFNHKASVSSSSSSSPASSSRMIPTVPKRPPLDRQHSSLKQPLSAPVNVPVMTEAMQRVRAMRQFDDIHYDDDTGEGEGEMLPPHEVVASRQSPMMACSVLEGAGRTLKGRDLRQLFADCYKMQIWLF